MDLISLMSAAFDVFGDNLICLMTVFDLYDVFHFFDNYA